MKSNYEYDIYYGIIGLLVFFVVVLHIRIMYFTAHIIKKMNRDRRINKHMKSTKSNKKSYKKRSKKDYIQLATVVASNQNMQNHNVVSMPFYSPSNGQVYVPPTFSSVMSDSDTSSTSLDTFEMKEIEKRREQENSDRIFAQSVQNDLNSIV